MLDAAEVLATRSNGSFILTGDLAHKVNEVVRKLPKNTKVYELNRNGPDPWVEFWKSLTPLERGSITRAFAGIRVYRQTIGEIGKKKSVESLIGWRIKKITAAFIYICFRLDDKEEFYELNHAAVKIF